MAANEDSDSNSTQKKTATATSTKKNLKDATDDDQPMSDDVDLKPRRIRRIKRTVEKTQLEKSADHSEDESSLGPGNKSDEDEFEIVDKKLQRMKNKIMKGIDAEGMKKDRKAKKKKNVQLEDPRETFNFDEESHDSEERQKGAHNRIKKEKKAPKKKARKDDNLGNSVNYVKTSNKLIGEIVNNDLYDSDEGVLHDGFNSRANKNALIDHEIEKDLDLDIGTVKKGNEKFL